MRPTTTSRRRDRMSLRRLAREALTLQEAGRTIRRAYETATDRETARPWTVAR